MTKLCKICGETNENQLLKFCRKCYYEEVKCDDIRKPIKQVSDKKKLRIKENGSEVKLFLEIWNERIHRCEVCHCFIPEPKPECFAHRLGKWRYPALRYNKKNIALVWDINCHKELDRRNKWRDFELIQEILW